MKNFKLYAILIVLVSATCVSFTIYTIEKERQLLKEDLIELSKVKYGLFSIDEWKRIVAAIITKKVDEFNFDDTNREEMRKRISELLYKIIGDFEQRFYKEKSRSIVGMIQGSIASMLGAFDNIKQDVPKFTEQILDFMNDPENRKAVRQYVIEKLNQYADNTFSKIDYATHNQILAKYQFPNREQAISGLSSTIESLDKQSKPYKQALLAMTLLVALYVVFARMISKNEYLVVTLMCLTLLVTGLILPMIEIDARISSMSFTLLGDTVSFKDQVLYYKSKSILEVVQLMLQQSRPDVLLVGILVFVFSVLFPLSKLIASILYIYLDQTRSSPFIKFLVFKTGKWSMADVMVIAIFMSYIGFSGIITEQLKQIENITGNMDILTTNKSNLLIGFFAFTSFAILSLLISHKLQFGLKSKGIY